MTSVPLLEDLQGPWATLSVEFIGVDRTQEVVRDVFPFTSVADFKRLLWIQRGGDPRWAPDHVFLGIRSPAGFRPVEFHWSATDSTVDLPDPLTQRAPNPMLVDEAGVRKPIGPTMLGALILETALSPEMMAGDGVTPPTITAISLSALAPAAETELTPQLFGGFYQLYFPWLTAPSQVMVSATADKAQRELYAASVPYMEDRLGRIERVQRLVRRRAGGTDVTMNTMVRLRWTLPPPSAKPESLEKTFYALRASELIPFLRFFPAQGAQGRSPLIKLGLRPDGSPIITDDRVFAQYLSEPAPTMKSAVILAKVPLNSPNTERGAAFTLYMFEDGASDITFEVPQRGATYVATVAAEAQRLVREVVSAIGFPPTTVPILRDLHATFKWTHPDPRKGTPLSAARLLSRIQALTPFFVPVPALPDEKAMAVFQWRAVSNYDGETAQFAYITQMVLRGASAPEEGSAAFVSFVTEIAERFGLTQEAAAGVLERWVERRGEAVTPGVGATAGLLAVPKHSTGSSVAVSGSHPEYLVEVNGVDSWSELQRLLSVVSVLMGGTTAEILTVTAAANTVTSASAVATAAIMETLEDKVAAADDATAGPVADPIEMAEFDPDILGFLGDIGMEGYGEEPIDMPVVIPEETVAAIPAVAGPGIEEPEALPPPDLEAAVAAADTDCAGNPWMPGEPSVKIAADWYMARLKAQNSVMFGYPSVGKQKGYSKTCQRRDDRQPNIMSLTEYTRVRACYGDTVRFVDLPPRENSDIPTFPGYDPKKRYEDEDFSLDPDSTTTVMDPVTGRRKKVGRPLWTVYRYTNKTRPGEHVYLMCSELWCVRDNLPLIRAEYEGEVGRGFAKSRNTCPFCGGKPIANMVAPQSGESVIVRKPKEGTGKIHSFVGTIRQKVHPTGGWPLPCCDTTPRLLVKYLDAVFAGQSVKNRDLAAGEGPGAEEEEDETAIAAPVEDIAEPPADVEVPSAEEPGFHYDKILSSMQAQYILGSDKALDAGKIALLPPAADAFFGQNGPRSVESRGIRPTFVEGATLFVRVGVDTSIRQPGRNLFAGLAPLLGHTSAEHTKQEFMNSIPVRAFESANYGTLVHEFAAKSTLSVAAIRKNLPEFCAKHGYTLSEANTAHLTRLYRAFVAYLEYLDDIRTAKQLRHLEHLLAEPGVAIPTGLLLVVLELDETATPPVRVVCPTFGIPTASQYRDTPVAFILNNRRLGSWEPLVFYNGTRQAIKFFGNRPADMAQIPSSVRPALLGWLDDWRRQCGRPAPPPHVWTPEKDSRGMPRLDSLLRRGPLKGRPGSVKSLVRDRSNRLAGVILEGSDVFVPCLDDGTLATAYPRIYEASSIPPVSVETYLRTYEELVVTDKFKPLRPVELRIRGGQIVALQLEIGTLVPVAPTATRPAAASTLPTVMPPVDAFVWERDNLILSAPDAPPRTVAALEESTASVEEQLTEAFQHVRLSFSRWLRQSAPGSTGTVIAEINRLVSGSLPLFEKRKRMDILLEPILREWIFPEVTEERRALSLLRVDCLSLPSGDCQREGACRWSSSRCLIHAPYREAGTDPVRIFTARLSDELLRYSARRREIMDGDVPTIRTPRGVVRIGDELFMATKAKEPAADILARLGFTGEAPMSFPEEMLRFEGAEEEEPEPSVETAATTAAADALPPSWTALGLQVATPPPGLADAQTLAFVDAMQKGDADYWQKVFQKWRIDLGLPGDPTRPIQWSNQDLFVTASFRTADVVYAEQVPGTAGVRITRWISTNKKADNPWFMIFWGPQHLLVHKGKQPQFQQKDLPQDFILALRDATPIPEEQARGFVEPPVPAPTMESDIGMPAPPAVALNIEGEPAATLPPAL